MIPRRAVDRVIAMLTPLRCRRVFSSCAAAALSIQNHLRVAEDLQELYALRTEARIGLTLQFIMSTGSSCL
jgi:hypothetical protein